MNEVIASKDKYTIALMHELSPYFVNLGVGRLKYTYLLEPYLSSSIGFEIFDGKLCMGIPEKLYMLMAEIRFFGVSYIPSHSAIFLVIDVGSEQGMSHPIALRLYLRKERVDLLPKFKFINLVRMDDSRRFNINSRKDTFKLPLRKERRLSWEEY